MDDLDLLLAEADAILKDLPPSVPAAPASPPSRQNPRTRRCLTVQLVSPSSELGRNCSLQPDHGCDSLRCTTCDFHVVHFDGFTWSDDVDYMFFRNRHPHEEKLKRGLVVGNGARAYCCQCQWANVEAKKEPPRSWVCGKH